MNESAKGRLGMRSNRAMEPTPRRAALASRLSLCVS